MELKALNARIEEGSFPVIHGVHEQHFALLGPPETAISVQAFVPRDHCTRYYFIPSQKISVAALKGKEKHE